MVNINGMAPLFMASSCCFYVSLLSRGPDDRAVASATYRYVVNIKSLQSWAGDEIQQGVETNG